MVIVGVANDVMSKITFSIPAIVIPAVDVLPVLLIVNVSLSVVELSITASAVVSVPAADVNVSLPAVPTNVSVPVVKALTTGVTKAV